MEFYTNPQTEISQLALCRIKFLPKYRHMKTKIMIDPGVYQLTTQVEYNDINALHEMVGKLHPNECISLDYPCDMNLEHTELFIEKSIRNNLKYAENIQYLCTIQSPFMDIVEFKREVDYLLDTIIKRIPQKPVGVGTFCRLMLRPNKKDERFCREAISYLWTHVPRGRRIHFYGVSKRFIEMFLPMWDTHYHVSVDSTKWTKRVHKNPPLHQSICCRKDTRNIIFAEYIRILQQKFPNPIEY